MNKLKIVLILRSPSGNGKSLLANNLRWLVGLPVTCVCAADEFMVDDSGDYEFKAERLGYCHKQCQLKFENALKDGLPLVICANTNQKHSDFVFYLEKAKQFGYITHVMVVENYEGTKDVHGLNETTLLKQEQNIKNSLKLR